MIRIQNLHKFFNKGRQNEIHVINDVSLELPEKGLVAVFGKSGCGKTTLLNVIGGLDSFHSGELTLDGMEMKTNADELRNRYIGYIFQNYHLNKNETCFDNVANALRLCGITDGDVLETRVMAALTNVGMEKYRSRTPDTLSGGQQQRIAIARAIVKNPHIILADEPTGNLDEANTIHIMNLLREIARDRLVLLVTHEASLVDYYCDTVIELQDGRVVDVKHNTDAFGYSARSKNDVFLGELEHSLLTNDQTQVEYFGEQPSQPIRLRIVNNGGRIYLQVQSPNVQILDETSEIRLREGVFERESKTVQGDARVDMSRLPPVEGSRFGKLFSLRSSIKSGYHANFHQKRKGKKLLLACMTCFSAVLVLLTAIFGTAIGTLIDADQAYNHNVFYVYTPNVDVSQQLNAAVQDPSTGVDYVRIYGSRGLPRGDQDIGFHAGYFETFETGRYSDSIRSHGVCLDVTLADPLPLVAGRKTELAITDLLITTAVADKLLEASPLSYIRDYDSLVGLVTNYFSLNGKTLRVAGVVESEETAIYFTEAALSQTVLLNSGSLAAYPASTYEISLESGSVIYVTDGDEPKNIKAPEVGDSILIHGHAFTVSEIKSVKPGHSFGEDGHGNAPYYFSRGYLLSDGDINQITKQIGETDPSATTLNSYGYVQYEYYYKEAAVSPAYDMTEEIIISPGSSGSMLYTVLHSNDPAKTTAWLNEHFSELSTGNDYWSALITPDTVYEEVIREKKQEIIGQLTVMGVLLIVMSVCMYFIMRSSLMNRIKEIGIYRAIGVSKRNLAFRFFVESMVLTTLTVLVGFLVISAALTAWLSSSPMMSQLFFYPPWLALIILTLLAGVCVFCGTVPILRLLRKSPSEILAKYDI